MKKIITDIRTLAALLIASATFVACSSDDNIIDDNIIDEQPASQQVYTLSVSATKGGDEALTRALSLVGKTLNATWATTENIYVKKGETWASGSLQPQADGTTATLKGSLSAITIAAGDNLNLQFPRSGELDYSGQVGTLEDIAAKYDYATATVQVKSVSATGNITPTEATTTFQNQQAIVKFTLVDKADGTTSLNATRLTVGDGTNTYTVTPASATSEIYVAIPGITNQTVTLTATTGSGTYTYEKANVTFTNGKYYAVSVKMAAAPLTVEALTAGTVKVNIGNGSGTLSSGMKYSVNGGAKTTITTTTSIAVNAGDKVQFYGNGTATQVYGDSPEVKILGDGDGFTCKAYGNIMSLLDEENFATKTDLPNQKYVFYGLFRDNTALTDASGLLLPATTLTDDCYQNMFYGCTALTAAPALPAKTLTYYCYYQMFRDCTALTAAPALPATTLAESCYFFMFKGCTNLSSVTCLATEGINQDKSTINWLDGVAASGTFTAATGAIWPEGVNGIPSGWTRVNPDGSAYVVAAEPEGLDEPLTVEALTAGTVKVNIGNGSGTLSSGMKYSVNGGAKTTITTTTSIAVNAGDKVQFYGNGTATQVYGDSPEVKILGDGDGFTCKAYGNIMSLLDEENFATKTDLPNKNYVFYGLFKDNTALTDASGLLLPAKTLAYGCYQYMFRDCTALTAAPALPAKTLADYCYAGMFDCCKALTAAPVLPATKLAGSCYQYMFNGCSNLSSVTCRATEGINANNSTYEWLYGVAATGTFTAATGTTWPAGADGIPSGWTRKNQ